MIAVAMIDNKPEPVFDLRQLLDMIERDYGLDIQDVMNLLNDAAENYTQYPELEQILDTLAATNNNVIQQHEDGVWGDSWLIACEEIRNAQEEIRAEIDALRSTSRKGNTKADIAKRLENIVSNMNGIL
jgi:hypothetical protein